MSVAYGVSHVAVIVIVLFFFFAQTGELLSSGTFLNDGDVKLGNSPPYK